MEASLTILAIAAVVAGTALWVWALVHVLARPTARSYRSGNQILWIIVIALTHAIGAVLYLAVGRPTRSERWHR